MSAPPNWYEEERRIYRFIWRNKGFILLGLIAAPVIVLVAHVMAFFFPFRSGPFHPNPTTQQIANEYAIGHALLYYAYDRDGYFPKTLADLPFNDAQGDELPAATRRFHDPKTGRAYDWLYYSGYGMESPKDTIVLASPRPVGPRKQRIVTFADGATSFMEEDAFVQKLTQQFNDRTIPAAARQTGVPYFLRKKECPCPR